MEWGNKWELVCHSNSYHTNDSSNCHPPSRLCNDVYVCHYSANWIVKYYWNVCKFRTWTKRDLIVANIVIAGVIMCEQTLLTFGVLCGFGKQKTASGFSLYMIINKSEFISDFLIKSCEFIACNFFFMKKTKLISNFQSVTLNLRDILAWE